MIATAVLLLPCSHVEAARDDGASGVVLYVDDDAPPDGGDGLSWATAFRFLQDALAVVHEPGSEVTEIRVGQGVYKPDQGVNQTPGGVDATFLIPSGLALRGGYAGLGAKDPDARNFEQFESILSGDLLGNDGPPGSWQNYEDNCKLVARVLGTESQSSTIEGFTITAATLGRNFPPGRNDYQLGAAMRCEGGSPTISHCKIQYNQAWEEGGISAFGCPDVVVSTCQFKTNRALNSGNGGAALNAKPAEVGFGGQLLVSNCVFEDNRATNGGAIYDTGLELLEVSDCIFLANRADGDGGAIYSIRSGAPGIMKVIVRRSHFEGNIAQDVGGAVSPRGDFYDCDFIGNLAGGGGGAIFYNNQSLPGTVKNCRFIANAEDAIGGAAIASTGGLRVGNCNFRDNWTAGYFGIVGGAVLPANDDILVNCTFNHNYSALQGPSAIFLWTGVNSLVSGCTIVNNNGPSSVGAVAGPGSIEISNSILWGNQAAQIVGSASISYSCIEDGWPGKGNISVDPMFIDALGPDGTPGTEDDDPRLQPGSPCIDAGDNFAVPLDTLDLDEDGEINELLPIDLDGNLRIMNDPGTPNTGHPPGSPHAPIVDMGAFEYQPAPVTGDMNGDGVVNVDDLLGVINSWGPCPAPPEPSNCPADMATTGGGSGADGVVNHADLMVVIENWS